MVPDKLKAAVGLKNITERLVGIYFLCLKGVVDYVGQSTKDAAVRLIAHRKTKEFDAVYFLPCAASDLNRAESAFARYCNARLNWNKAKRKWIVPIQDLSGDGAILAKFGIVLNDKDALRLGKYRPTIADSKRAKNKKREQLLRKHAEGVRMKQERVERLWENEIASAIAAANQARERRLLEPNLF